MQFLRPEPAAEFRIFSNPALQTASKTHQGDSAVSTTGGGEGHAMVHLPQQQQGHSRLTDCRFYGAEVGVLAYPHGQAGIDICHLGAHPGWGQGVSLCLFHAPPPGHHIHSLAGYAVPPYQRSRLGLPQRRVKHLVPCDVAQDLRHTTDTGGDRSTGRVRKWFSSQPLKKLQQGHSGSTCRNRTRFSVRTDQGRQEGPKPPLPVFTTWGYTAA